MENIYPKQRSFKLTAALVRLNSIGPCKSLDFRLLTGPLLSCLCSAQPKRFARFAVLRSSMASGRWTASAAESCMDCAFAEEAIYRTKPAATSCQAGIA